MKSVIELYNQAFDTGKFPVGSPEETTIATSSKYSYLYALDVLENRFELGEPAIATESYHSYAYATEITKCRFELGEAAIATNAYHSYLYAKYVIKGRFLIGERAIIQSEFANEYMNCHMDEFDDEELTLLKLKYSNIWN